MTTVTGPLEYLWTAEDQLPGEPEEFMRKTAVVAILTMMMACTVKLPSPPSSPPPSPAPRQESQWRWGVVPMKVELFDNETPIKVTERVKRKRITRKLLDRGITRRLVRMLEQSHAFEVVENPLVHDAEEGQGAGEQASVRGDGNEIEAPREAQLEIFGVLKRYDLTPASVANGVGEDPLLQELQDNTAVENAFNLIVKRAEKIEQDLIAFEVRLLAAKTNNEIGYTAFQCTPREWEAPLESWFGKQLRQSLSPPRTPIQRATQACLIKVVNWVGEWYDLWRKNPEKFPNYRKIQENLNLLGYNCGSVDGIRGPRTAACIQDFLTKTSINENDLEKRIEEELKNLPLRPPPTPKRTPKLGEEKPSKEPSESKQQYQNPEPKVSPPSPPPEESQSGNATSHEPDVDELPDFYGR